MATYLKGMDQAEARALTEAMMHSGDILDLSGIKSAAFFKFSAASSYLFFSASNNPRE